MRRRARRWTLTLTPNINPNPIPKPNPTPNQEEESENGEESEEEESDDGEVVLEHRQDSDGEASEDPTPPPRAAVVHHIVEGAGGTCRLLTPRELSRMAIDDRKRRLLFAQTVEAKERAAASSVGEVTASPAAAEGEEGGELAEDESGDAVAEGQHEGGSDKQQKKQKSLYVCTGCGWSGTARKLGPKACIKGSVPSNNHASRRPNCRHGPCLVRSTERMPGQSRKQDAAAYLARCTPEQRALGLPPTGGCAPCMPTPEGRPEGRQWVVVQIPEGVAPGETFEHLNHNGRFMVRVTVPEGAKAGDTLGAPGNKRRPSACESQRSAERRVATIECATAERDAAEIATDAQAAAERDAAERAAAKRAADAEAKRLAAAITAQSDAHPTACGSVQVRGGGPTGEVEGAAGGGEGGSGATSASAHGGGEAAQGGGHAGFVIYGDLQPSSTEL